MDVVDGRRAERQHPDRIVGVGGIVRAVGVSRIDDERLVGPDDELALRGLDVEDALENVERFGLFVVVVIRQGELLARFGLVDAQTDGRALVVEARRRADRADVGVAVVELFEGVGVDVVIAHEGGCGRTAESVSTDRRQGGGHGRATPRHTYGADEGVPMPTEHAVRIDGQRIEAVHHAAGGDRWLFFCHGFRSDKTGSYEGRCERAVGAGYDAVRFDFRGSGDSDGAFVEATLTSRIEDLRAVVERFDPPSYACFGSSFGAKVALHAAAGPLDPVAIVGRAPVTYNRAFEADRRTVAAEGTLRYDDEHAVDARFFEDLGTYGFDDAAGAIEAPVALFHGSDDESVPIADSFEAAAALEADVLLEKYAGEGHRFSEAAEARLRDRALGWLESVYGAGVHERG